MREIKFRAWCKCYDTMIFSEKYYTKRNFGYDFYCDSTGFKDDKHIIMQYTGLKDKNGKEIYEGDIVQDFQKFNADVKFMNGAFKYCSSDGCPVEFLNIVSIMEDKLEVIGNIYENPELLREA